MKIALIQHSFENSKKQTIKKTTQMIKKASKKGAKLVVLQELHQTHYFCIEEDERNFELANSYEKDIRFWSKIASENEVVLVTSLFEKRAKGLYHNTAVVFEKDGSIAGKYRKMHIPDDPSFYEKFYFTPGDLGYKPIKTSVGNLGVLICWDQWYPEAARLMSLAGADILIYPTAIGWFDEDKKEEKTRQLQAWQTIQRSHAIANGIPVVAVNRVGIEKHQNSQNINFWGNSFVSDSLGKLIHVSPSNKEDLGIVDINLSEDVRCTWPFLRDRRIETYSDITKRFID